MEPQKPYGKFLRQDQGGLAERLAAVLTRYLVEEKLPPGAYLPSEGELCERYGTSRGVVREATKILEARGLVEVHRGKGVAVRPVDGKPMADALGIALKRHETPPIQVWQARMILEVQIASMAAGSATEQDLARVLSALDKMRQPKRSLAHYVSADITFHKALVEATKNIVLSLILESIDPLLREGRRITLATTGVQRALLGHERIYAALRDKDPERAANAMREHLEWARADLETAVQSKKPQRVRKA
jgi:GntR family transcriptional repressor for pyruvate dehydrogenase complex